MITYLDRACIATLAPGIMRDLGLTTVQMGYVFTVFQLAYALFEIPTAWWADRKGTRSVLSRIVIWWSCLTAATGAAFNYPVLLAIRFLFGAGEAGAWPCVARTFSRWIPRSERGTVQGIFFAGAHLGGGLTVAMVRFAARHEYARTVEDVLARRFRLLFLDAALASSLSAEVGELLRQETGVDPQAAAFRELASSYLRMPV